MTNTASASLATQPPWRRRLLATALIVGVGAAVGTGATGLASNCGPVDTGRTTLPTWTGDAKDHPNYGPVDTGGTCLPTWTGDAKDHPNYGPVDIESTTSATWTGDVKDHPNYGPITPA